MLSSAVNCCYLCFPSVPGTPQDLRSSLRTYLAFYKEGLCYNTPMSKTQPPGRYKVPADKTFEPGSYQEVLKNYAGITSKATMETLTRLIKQLVNQE